MSGHQPGEGRRWIEFATVMFVVAGIFNVIAGVGALVRAEYFREGEMLYRNLQLSGWTWLIAGVLQMIVGYLVFKRSDTGRLLGIIVTVFSMVTWFVFFAANPWWALVVLVVDVAIIYALTAYREYFR